MRRGHAYLFLLFAALPLGGCATAFSDAEPIKDVECVQQAPVSLRQAVETAERQGGRAVDAHFRQDEELGCLTNKPSYFDVTLLTDGKLRTVSVDAHSNVVEPGAPGDAPIWKRISRSLDRLFERGASAPEAAARVPVTLPEAVATVEGPRTKIVAAQLDEKGDRFGYSVKLVEGGKLKFAWVDAG
jgi:uncharacterized membrane protein YkoI